jgi:uncharacterized protein (TIGR03437 family)
MNRKIIYAGIAGLAAAALIYAHAEGPDPRHTAAPGDDPLACATAGCHTGTGVNAGGGTVVLKFPAGQTYTPGQQQTFQVVVSDPKAKTYGFQLTARLVSNLSQGQAGDFSSVAGEIVLCDDGSLKGTKGCLASAPVQFIEHNTPRTDGTWNITWTPPTTNVGNVMFYVAGNGANGDGNNTGDHIYTANYTMTPAVAGSPTPTISAGGVISAQSFNPKAGVASGTWLEIYGTNLSSTTRGWSGSDFKGSSAPTSLDGVSVSINGKNAYVDYVSPGQVNVQVPDDPTVGSAIPVVVTTSAGASNSTTVTKTAIAPALLGPAAFNVGGKQYVVAQFSDGTYVGKTGLISGLSFRPAKAGDVITIYGIGFGPVTPSVAAGQIASGLTSLATKPNFLFGQTAASLSCSGCYYGLASGQVGLYQFNIQVPNAGTGDIALNVDVGGVSTNQQLFITLQ